MRCAPKVLVTAALLAFAYTAWAYDGHHHGLSVSTEDREVTSCDQLRVRSDDREVARSEERLTLPQTSSTIRVEAADNGGIYVVYVDSSIIGSLHADGRGGLRQCKPLFGTRDLAIVRTNSQLVTGGDLAVLCTNAQAMMMAVVSPRCVSEREKSCSNQHLRRTTHRSYLLHRSRRRSVPHLHR